MKLLNFNIILIEFLITNFDKKIFLIWSYLAQKLICIEKIKNWSHNKINKIIDKSYFNMVKKKRRRSQISLNKIEINHKAKAFLHYFSYLYWKNKTVVKQKTR